MNWWRNPEDDLPAGVEGNRDVCDAALGRPQDSGEFVAAVRDELRTSLDHFESALAQGTRGGAAIVKNHGEPWIRLSPRGEAGGAGVLGGRQGRDRTPRWGTSGLLDILK
ncbi:hypothetical protein [Streptomyces brevispora]|uniref:hypothetical protein n=1 Tax=Streptomyces brevispora TaxID=887462 RepID=UPI0035D55BF9